MHVRIHIILFSHICCKMFCSMTNIGLQIVELMAELYVASNYIAPSDFANNLTEKNACIYLQIFESVR